jgi:membrane protease subunit HflK
LFKVNNPETSLRIAAESAMREVVSRTPIQAVMSNRRQQVADETRELLQSRLDQAQSGILVTQVQLQRVDPPAAVIDAFNDVQRARADQERARNEAQAYSNDILPKARGDAARILQEAQAYQSQVVNLAQGEAKRFDSVYQSYAQAKDVTAWRLYLDSMDEVLKKASKVVVDSSGKGGNGGVLSLLQLQDKDKAKPARRPADGHFLQGRGHCGRAGRRVAAVVFFLHPQRGAKGADHPPGRAHRRGCRARPQVQAAAGGQPAVLRCAPANAGAAAGTDHPG